MSHRRAAPSFNIFSTTGVIPLRGLSAQSGLPSIAQGRAEHARMLAYAAKRRLAAGRPSVDRAYWKACAPAALTRAITIRREAGLAKLP